MYFTNDFMRQGTTNLVHYIICYPTYPPKNQTYHEYPYLRKKTPESISQAVLVSHLFFDGPRVVPNVFEVKPSERIKRYAL